MANTKLTPQSQSRICQAIKLGATYDMAANYGGIHYSCFRAWMVKGEKAKSGIHRDFYEAVKEAESEGAVGLLEKIEDAAENGAWQAAAWKLERRYPNDYGRSVQQVEHSGPGGSELVFRVEYADQNDNTTETTSETTDVSEQ